MRQILKLQTRDRKLKSLRKVLTNRKTRWPKHLSKFKRYVKYLSMCQGVLVYQPENDPPAFVVSYDFLVEVMLILHYNMAHSGRQKLLELTKEYVWHPCASMVAADITRSCSSCQRVKIASQLSPPLHKITTTQPFELMAADLMLLPMTANRSMCCLVVIDHHSKWLAAAPLKNKTT